MTAAERVRAARDLIASTADAYPGRVTLSCSFGGPSGMVLLDLAQHVDPHLPVFVLDTGLLFGETTALIERVQRRYGLTVERIRPQAGVAEQAAAEGEALWARDPDRCCALRKIAPLDAHLRAYDAWLTAIRRSQTPRRADLPVRAYDPRTGVVKIAPLLDWTDDDVWAYVEAHDVPVNTLHFEGYASLGCVPCTARVNAGDDPRAGRWPGFAKVECGIHA